MEDRLRDLRSERNPKARIKVMEGHFATTHSHINMYMDMSTVKYRHNNARETARELAANYLTSTPIDTIVCIEGTELIGAYMAEILSENSVMSINSGKNISVLTPELDQTGQMFFRDNAQRMVQNMQVLLLAASTTTGKSVNRAIECVAYYGGRVSGISSIFSAVNQIGGIEVNAIFHQEDLPQYKIYSSHDCPYCKANQKVEALVNSYGYSKL